MGRSKTLLTLHEAYRGEWRESAYYLIFSLICDQSLYSKQQSWISKSLTSMYYNKEYREGFPRGFLLTAAIVKVSKTPEGLPMTVFLYLIYRSRPYKMLRYVKTYVKHVKTIGRTRLRNHGLNNGCSRSVLSDSKLPVSSFV